MSEPKIRLTQISPSATGTDSISGNVTITNDLTVGGNLTVSGDTTTLNVQTLLVEDNEIILNSNVTGSPSLNASVTVNRGSSSNAFLLWNEGTDKWGWSDDGNTVTEFATAVLKTGDTMTGLLNVASDLVVTGNVGIGTASPGFTLETVGTVGLSTNGVSVLATFGASNNTDKYLRIRNSDGNFEIGSDSSGHYLYGNGNLPVRIFANGVNRLHVTSDGNVGIGTTSPQRKLHVEVSSGTAVVRAESTATSGEAQFEVYGKNSGGTARTAIFKYDNADKIRLATASAIPIAFETSDAERMRIDSSGNVCIGTTSTGRKFDVRFSSNNSYSSASMETNSLFVYLRNPDVSTGSYSGIHFAVGNNSDAAIAGVRVGEALCDITFGTRGAGSGNIIERMRIASDGKVGIGTTNPSKSLSVNGDMSANGTLDISGDGGEGYVASRVVLRSHNNYRGTGIFLVGETSAVSNNTFFIGTPYTSHSSGVYIRHTANNYATDFQSSAYTAAGNTLMYLSYTGAVSIPGSLSKGSGSFKIDHPLPEKSNTHHLVHSFIEGPQADLIYSGRVQLENGLATVNIDTHSNMTEGTFVALCRDIRCFTTNESDWDAIRGSVLGNILTIECQNPSSNAMVSWMVIGERQDQHMYDTGWTDENGKVIVEPEKETLNT